MNIFHGITKSMFFIYKILIIILNTVVGQNVSFCCRSLHHAYFERSMPDLRRLSPAYLSRTKTCVINKKKFRCELGFFYHKHAFVLSDRPLVTYYINQTNLLNRSKFFKCSFQVQFSECTFVLVTHSYRSRV